jgi:flagellar basal-body rod protein FlgF
MDRLIYTAMSGASTALDQHATTAHNLANVGTHGFRAQLDAIKSSPLPGGQNKGVVQVMEGAQSSDFSRGPIQQTSRPLDLAIQGAGWFVVQSADGNEAMTRGGSFQLSPNGVLQTQSGLAVVGESGPLTIPPDSMVTVGKDGTVSVSLNSTNPSLSNPVGKLKLANPPVDQLQRGQDGLFRLQSGSPPSAAAEVTLVSGALEGSNVNVVDAMVKLIALGRQFDLNIQMLKNAESNEAKASQVLNLG